ncbi:MAG: response regulator [Desulfobacteraceae bacterium]|nr:MAG: response regulator [Desulfobacteraceae bacterium]
MDEQSNSNVLKVLLIEGDDGLARRIEAMLSGPWSCRIHTAQTLAQGLQALSDWHFDAALLDLALSDGDGTDTFARLQRAFPRLPIIVLDESGDQAVELARQGACGYFPKDRMDACELWADLVVAAEMNKRTQALRRSETKFRTIVEQLEDAYYETDLNGLYTVVNDTLCKHLQRPREEIVGRPKSDYSTPQATHRLRQALQEVYAAGVTPDVVDDEVVRGDGSIIFAELNIVLMRDLAGNPTGYSYISRDATEKKSAEKALKISEEKYRNILASIDDGYFEVDLRGDFFFFNQALVKILGRAKDRIAGLNNRDVMDARNAKKVFRAYNKIFRTGKPEPSLQYEIIRGDGVKRYIESSVSLLTDDDHQPVGFRGLARDITARKKAEREIARAKARAEEATLAKSNFLANMSHEIRTPLNGIIGMYNLMLTTELTAAQADFVDTGKRSADSLLAVINDILDFSKIEAGQLDIESVDFDLRKAVQEIVALPAIQAHAKGLEFVYRIDPEVPSFLLGDTGRLRQILMNLLNNAIKFTQTGEVALSVFAVEQTPHKAELRFAVRDTGIGISKTDQACLFRSFQQADVSTTRKFGGTGLGLAISKRLAEMMGGQMGVESELHRGATFWFSAVFDKQPGVRERTFQVPDTLSGKRILIVDDNRTNLDILAGYLKYWGCDCDRATGPQMALSLMHALAKAGAPYDLVITDMLMPEMDGAELGRCIKSDPALKDTLLVMLTSQGLRGDAAEMKRIGFSAHLTKPVRRSLLFDCLIAVINRDTKELIETTSDRPDPCNAQALPECSGATILLAEDNPINQKLAMHLLGKFGLNAEAVINGRQAVEALARKAFDLVLMDIQMPEMDGLAATRIIRDPHSAVLNHRVPIVALTAHAMKGDREKCLDAGMDDYLAKPIQPDALLKVLEQQIGRRKAYAARPRAQGHT